MQDSRWVWGGVGIAKDHQGLSHWTVCHKDANYRIVILR